jgi:hypothetical protein
LHSCSSPDPRALCVVPLSATGLAAFGSRRKERLEVDIEGLLEGVMALSTEGQEGEDEEAAKRAGVTAIRTVSAYVNNILRNPFVSASPGWASPPLRGPARRVWGSKTIHPISLMELHGSEVLEKE